MDGIHEIFTKGNILHIRFTLTMKVSVCIALYNGASYLKEMIESIINQTYTNFECILVDDHSTDNTVELLSQYVKSDDRLKLYVNITDKTNPYIDAHNKSYQLGTGDILIRMDQDDIAKLNMIEKFVDFMSTHPEYDIACAAFQPLFSDGSTDASCINRGKNLAELQRKGEFVLEYQKDNSLWTNQCSCIRRDFYNKHKPVFFCNKFADIMFWWTVLSYGANPGYIEDILLEYRIRSTSTCFHPLYTVAKNDREFVTSCIKLKYTTLDLWYKETKNIKYRAAADKYRYILSALDNNYD